MSNKRRKNVRSRRKKSRLIAEQLEDRRVLAGVTVGNALDVVNGDTSSITALIADDGGDGISLREAITAANNTSGSDTITFDASVFSGGANSLIRLSGTELSIVGGETLTIDGSTGTEIVITADANDDDVTFPNTHITDAFNNSNTSDNSRVFAFNTASVTAAGNLTLRGLNLTGANSPDGSGGAIFFNTNGVLTVDKSTISGNHAADFGGGIFASSGAVVLTQSTVSGNSSGTYGGGIMSSQSSLTLTSSTISGNRATVDGGGIWHYRGAVVLKDSTVTQNQSGNTGGGIFVFDDGNNPPVSVQNSIVAGNSANTGPDLNLDPDSPLSFAYSLIGDKSGNANLVEAQNADVNGNLIGDTSGAGFIDAMLAPLADNGGPSRTHALLPGSPAIDAGNSTLTTDQRGFTRPVDFSAIANATGGDGSDIGAFELQELPNLIVTTASDVIADDGVTSLREAINFANSGTTPADTDNDPLTTDTITFDASVFNGEAADVIRLNGTELSISETLIIDGTTGTDIVITADANDDDVTLSGTDITDAVNNTNTSDNSRVLRFTATTGDLTLAGLTLTGGNTFNGGAIVFDSNGQLTLNQSTVSGNDAGIGRGGGIYTKSGMVTLTSSTVSGNRATGITSRGGGIYAYSGSVTLTSSTVSGNRSTGNYSAGGGIYTRSGSVTLTSSTVSGNRSTGNYSDGGGIFTRYGALTLTSSTVSQNSAGSLGGGLAIGDGTTFININNSIVAGNTATSSDNIYWGSAQTNFNGGFNLLGPGAQTGGVGDVVVSDNNPLLAPLADNGGPTQTHALLPGSPAINAGDPNFDVNGPDGLPNTADDLLFDQRGSGFARVFLGRVDMGAFESVELVVNSTADTDDGDLNNGTTTLREAINFANTQAGVDTITFDPNVFNGEAADVIRLNGTELSISETLIIDGTTGTEIVITADANDDDVTLSGTDITDVVNNINIADNSRVLRFTATTGNLTLAGLTLTGGNTVDGGAIVFDSSGRLTLNQSTVSGNNAGAGNGGGIYAFSGSVTLTSSTVSGNTSGNDGGGIAKNYGSVTLTSSTLSGNKSGDDGGGLHVHGAFVTLIGSTVTQNSASGFGGGLAIGRGTMSINNSIVSGNTGTFNDNIYRDSAQTNLYGGFNLLGPGAQTGGVGDVFVSDNNPLLAPLADNGGPTLTHALRPDSPAVDAGNSTLTTDQRGFARPVDDPAAANATGGNGSDIGAFERRANEFNFFSPIAASIVENTQLVHTLVAIGNLGETVSYSLTGTGADNGQFEIIGGDQLQFQSAPDFESPTDVGGITGDNVYEVTVQATNDTTSETVSQTILVTVTNAAEPATFVVDLATDENDGNFSSGDLSLREAIELANANLGLDTITFDNSVFNTAQTIQLGSELVLSEGVVINGPGADLLTLDAGGGSDGVIGTADGYRLFDISVPTSISGLTLTGGDVSGNGGAIRATADLTLDRVAITGNASNAEGGGIRAANLGHLTVTNSTIDNNQASVGGGISGDVLTITSSTISGNVATGNGGGVFTFSHNTRIENSTITKNRANEGGGVWNNSSPLTIQNTIIADNTATSSNPDLTPGSDTPTLNYSLIGTSGPSIDGNTGSGNVLDQSVNLGALADNGGPTQTHALLSGSPAINAGDPNFDVNGPDGLPNTADDLLFDQRGSGFARVFLGRVDMGAFESVELVVNSTADTDDGDLTNGTTTLREAVHFANSDAGANFVSFDASISGQTITLSGTELAIAETISIDASSLTAGVTIDGNKASRVLNFTSTTGDLELRGLTLTGGSVSGHGGAVKFNSGGTLSIFDSTLHNNTALGLTGDDGDGGAIFVGTGTVSLTNTTVSTNFATDDGGAIRSISGPVTIDSSTITENTADDDGGGISRLNGTGVTIRNSIVAQNIANGSDNDLDTTGTPTVMYSLIGDNTGTSLSPAPVGSPDSNGNLIGTSSSPIDPQLGPLANNGGPTQTHALLPGSPAVNAGSQSLLPSDASDLDNDGNTTEPIPFDQRGTGYSRLRGGQVDMGAYEVQSAPQVESVVIDNDAETGCTTSCQRSMVRKLTVTFDSEVAIESGAFSLNQTLAGSSQNFTIADADVAMSVVAGKTVAVLTFSNSTTGIVGSSLADGNYTLTVDSTKIRAGTATMAANHTDTFFRFYGDIDGNRLVDGQDFNKFRDTFFKAASIDETFNGDFDFDGDGLVDGQDFNEFRSRFFTQLTQ